MILYYALRTTQQINDESFRKKGKVLALRNLKCRQSSIYEFLTCDCNASRSESVPLL